MKLDTALCFFLAAVALVKSQSLESKSGGQNRKGKLFSLFSVVQFKNEACKSTATLLSGNVNRNGTCFTSAECTEKGGSRQGSCASGFGVCCVFIISDTNGGTINQNCSYIQNPDFPPSTTATSDISYTINKCSDNVCTIRLDFEVFTIQGIGGTNAVDEGTCANDALTITSSTSQIIPVICGENAQQHMYIEMGRNSGDTSMLEFSFSGSGARQWDIKVTQLECGNPSNAPEGCLQYYSGTTGRFTTFNFNPTNDNHLNNQQYSSCIRAEEGFCCIQYQVCPDVAGANGFSINAAITTAEIDSNCATSDYIGISQSSGLPCQSGSSNGNVNNLYCGLFLNNVRGQATNAQICDCTAPFSIDVFTDAFADGANAAGMMNVAPAVTTPSRGVCLEWVQVPCTN